MKRTLILTGAGAVAPWKGPRTCEITKKIREDDTFKTVSGTPVGEYLYKKLEAYIHPSTPNFETILDLIETLYDYSYGKLNDTKIPIRKESHLALLFKTNDGLESEWLNCKQLKDSLTGFSDIPEPDLKIKYFCSVYYCYLDIVVDQIKKYNSTYKNYAALNSKFVELLNLLSNLSWWGKRRALRLYSLNYDRLPVFIAEGYKWFEGFSKDKNSFMVPDPSKIVTDSRSNCYFNLHGSVFFWKDWSKTGSFDWILSNDIKKYSDNDPTSSTDQSGRNILHSNIITGLHKTSQVLLSPFSEFQQRFIQDCIEAETVIIIGYSFSDHHINAALKNIFSDHKKVVIISQIEEDELGNWIGNLRWTFQRQINFETETNYPTNHWIKKMNQAIFTNGFEDFLLNNLATLKRFLKET